MIGSAGAAACERVTNGAGKQRETNCCGILRVLSRHTPIVSSPGGTGTLSIASRTFIPVYICQATSTKPHFQQSTLLPSHTYIKHLDTIHYRWHPMGHTSSSCQMFILSFPRHIFHKTKCLECLFFMHCCLNSRYGVGDITPQNHQLHFCIIPTDWTGRPNETNEPISPDNNHLVTCPAIDKNQKTGRHIKPLTFCTGLVGNKKRKSS